MFDLQDLPFAALNLIVMPICWMKKGFSGLSLAQQTKVMWDALVRAGRKIEELHATNTRLEKELTAWNVFGPNVQRVIKEFAIHKSNHRAINLDMKQ